MEKYCKYHTGKLFFNFHFNCVIWMTHICFVFFFISSKYLQRSMMWKPNPIKFVLSQSLQSVLLLLAGQLSIDRSFHMNFTLMLHYQNPMYQLVERWYDNYHTDANLASHVQLDASNLRSTQCPVSWPWWLPMPEQGKHENYSWELILTWNWDICDLTDLHTCTDLTTPCNKSCYLMARSGNTELISLWPVSFQQLPCPPHVVVLPDFST